MPLLLREDLPAFDQLQEEGVFMMKRKRSEHQDIRPLEIGILNLMPDKLTAETQLLRLLASTPLHVHATLLKTASYEPQNVEPGHLEKFYTTIDALKQEAQGLDGLIVTGAPVEDLEFDDVKYWQELKDILDWAQDHVHSVMGICWGAQAVLKHYYDIEKKDLPEKKFGVFSHDHVGDSPLTQQMDDQVWAPHSRHTEILLSDVEKNPDLKPLLVSPEAGVHIVSNTADTVVAVCGHGEYDRDTLDKEYKRDLSQGRDDVPLPVNYYPDNDPNQTPHMNWRANTTTFFRNWVTQVYEQTKYDVKENRLRL